MKIIKISQKLSPKLIITPQLKQALYILQLPQLAFKKYLLQKISENPLLQPPNDESLNAKIKKILNSNHSKYQHIQSSFNEAIGIKTPIIEGQKSDIINLQHYLFHQLEMVFLNEEELSIAQELISNIDTNGYLRISLEQFAKEYNLPLERTEKILKIIQGFDPPGVGARNLQECLLIQLKDKKQEQSLAYKIVHLYLKELSRKKYFNISKKLHCSVDEVKEAVKEIISLNPKPGANISKERYAIAIKPDIILKIHRNKLESILDESDLPKLKINSEYKKILNNPDTPKETKEFIIERLKSALWLIKIKEERRKNTMKVIKVITQLQKQALCKDMSYLKPLRLKDIAHKTGLHLSTVGRIISNKYVSTPEGGTVMLKDLFSPRLNLGKGGTISRKGVLSRIKNIILHDKERHLSDQMISGILRDQGVNISRRTVAKYRNLLKLPSSFLR